MNPDNSQRRPRKFIIGSDHAGRQMKDRIRQYLIELGHQVEDRTPDQEKTDYPLVGEDVARRVARGEGRLGVLVCGTGIGISIAANKVPGIRAALLYSPEAADYARRHNDANVLVFGGRTMRFPQVRRCIDAFLDAEFEGGRHGRRNDHIRQIEQRSRQGTAREPHSPAER
ncbi:MAG: ribose 5-phosphate isomerase B [Candidatus Brocadiaceae bacterium]